MTDVVFLVTAALAFFAGAMAVAAYFWRRQFMGELEAHSVRIIALTKQLDEISRAHSKIDLESVNRRLGEIEMRRTNALR